MKLLYSILLSCPLFTVAQEYTGIKARKELTINRTVQAPVIDGKLDDIAWHGAAVAKNFVQNDPVNGIAERQRQKTEVFITYDDEAIYFGAHLYDASPDSILQELGKRDDNGRNADFFAVWINPYADGINDINFFITAAGVQIDSRTTANNGDDINWDAVWKSEVAITNDGWIAEVAIPYSALRFPKTEVQEWALNLGRSIRRTREMYSWSYIDNTIGRPEQYAGVLKGIKNITPPLRLSALPFISLYSNNYDGSNSLQYNAGMDIKYGINDAFTLDMTLVPDFGQVAFDNQVLNLSPFEVRFNENRPFFTEGTELFDKGGLFYSRRVGNSPTQMLDGSELNDNEIITGNPNQVKLLNATKVSGTTAGNMGVGVFNAITGNTYATVQDTVTGEDRQILTEGLANYSVVVLDQRLRNSSSITLINTNVSRQGDFRDANVTGFLTSLANKKNTYRLDGSFKGSSVWENNDQTTGYASSLQLNKTSGNIQFYVGQNIESDTYQINDLGFLSNNNEFSHYAGASYQIFQPTKKLNRFGYFLNMWRGMLYAPREYTGGGINLNAFYVTKKFLGFGWNANVNPTKSYDYFAARVAGRVFVDNPGYNFGGWVSTDYRKRYAIDFNWNAGAKTKYENLGFKSYFINSRLSRRMRINNSFLLIYGFNENFQKHDLGWVYTTNEPWITFGRRDINNFTMNINGTYIFTPNMNLALNFRHNWTRVNYTNFYGLEQDGSLVLTNYEGGERTAEGDFTSYHNTNFNSWNIDLIYTWRFAPGSDLIFAWKNAIFTVDDDVNLEYFDNLNGLFIAPAQNNFSIKLLYYLDSQYLKKLKRK